MASFDLRSAVLLVINILKSFLQNPSNWDSFDTIGHLTWPKLSLFAIIYFLFSYTSMKVPLFNSANADFVHIQYGDLSVSHSVSFLACVLLPQNLYWYAYPILILISFCSTWVSNFIIRFRDVLPTIPVSKILVSATIPGDGNQEIQGENQETELQAQEEAEVGDIEQGRV